MSDLYSRYNIQPPHKSLEYLVKTRLTFIRKFLVYLKAEKSSHVSLSFFKRFYAWCHGFTSTSYVLYNLDKNISGDYLRDFSDINYNLNYPGASSVNDKLNFFYNMKLAGIPSPAVLTLIDRGSVLYPGANFVTDEIHDWIVFLLKKYKTLVFKPAFGHAGFGVFFLKYEGNNYKVNGMDIELSEICRFLKKQSHYLATEFVEQAEYARRIYPRTTNTVRVLTVMDKSTGKPFVGSAAHRIGTNRSFPLDNFHGGTGGLCTDIDIDSGELGPAAGLSGAGRLFHSERHPETGEQIKGLVIPHWGEIKKMILAAATHFAGSPYIGWDLIVTDEGCSFIEGNSPPGVAVWQVHRPLLSDPRVKSFYKNQGII